MDKMDWIRCPKCRYTCVIRFKDGKMEETVPEKA